MTTQDEHDKAGTMSVKDMQGWLREEIRDSAKAHELRVKDATELVTAYADGQLTTEEAMERLNQHDRRWGEALFGASAFPGLTDKEILDRIDAARTEQFEGPRKPFSERTQGSGSPKR